MEIQLNKFQKETLMAIVGKCSKLFDSAEKNISETVISTTKDFNRSTKVVKKLIGKNLLFSFVAAIVLVVTTIGGYALVQNYKGGTKMAKAKAMEVLSAEQAKIEQNAVEAYKNSVLYKEDACKVVAGNISKLEFIHYLYVFIRSEDIEKYPAISSFYNNYLSEGNKEYKEMYGK